MCSVGRSVIKYDIINPGGSLTLTSGTAAIKPGTDAAIGGGLNGGVLSMTKGLANDLKSKKIRVNCVVPGLVQTELWAKMGRSEEETVEQVEKMAKTLPVGFVATPEHIAEAYLYVVRADYATGTFVEIGEYRITIIKVWSLTWLKMAESLFERPMLLNNLDINRTRWWTTWGHSSMACC